MDNRKNTRTVMVGNVPIGGQNPVVIQSMTNTKTEDVQATVVQIRELIAAGCQIVRVAVPNMEAAKAISEIKKMINIPLVADIHFDYRLAIAAIDAGADKIRINPGNIGSEEKVAKILEAAKEKGIPIRIGVNSGSIDRRLVEKYGVGARAMVENLREYIEMFERHDFGDIVLSMKSSDIYLNTEVNQMVSSEFDYPLHLGITESGSDYSGLIKSSIGLGRLLMDGIGDTIRVSLTGDPVKEIKAAKRILISLGLLSGINIVSCPTCGRCNIDLESLTRRIEKATESINKNLTIAIMGCAVNGPGEAREADIGIAGGVHEALLFKNGEIISKIPEDEIEKVLLEEIERQE